MIPSVGAAAIRTSGISSEGKSFFGRVCFRPKLTGVGQVVRELAVVVVSFSAAFGRVCA